MSAPAESTASRALGCGPTGLHRINRGEQVFLPMVQEYNKSSMARGGKTVAQQLKHDEEAARS